MAGAVDWRDAKYEENYEQELLGLERRRDLDPQLKVEDLEAVLKHLYIQQGCDWCGRGELQDLSIDAAIAAHESFIARWKAGR